MSKLEVDKIDPQSGTNLELGTSGDTITIPTGVTLDASNATTTLPSTVVTTTGTQTLTNKSIAATQLTGTITPSDNTVSLAKLTATGTKDATTFLRGDNSFSSLPASGITQADMWRTTTNVFKTSSAYITANWEQVDTDSPGFIGSSMTQSGGVFTFPSTGIYLILANMYIVPDGVRTYSGSAIAVTTNNGGSWSRACETLQHVTAGGNYINASSHFILDVTDTSNVKVIFEYVSAGSANIYGDTGQTNTGMSFIRLGDT